MSVPYSLMVISHCARILRDKLPEIIDEMEPGGSKDPYKGLNSEETEAMRELIRYGVNPRAFFSIHPGQDGSLPVLAPTVKQIDPTYFSDFWEIPGYLGADPNGSAVRDRLQHKSIVAAINIPQDAVKQNWEDRTGVDDAWQRLLRKGSEEKITLRLESMPSRDAYVSGAELKVITGTLAGRVFPIEKIAPDYIVPGGAFGVDEFMDELAALKPGDEVMLDNSDYLAMQTYYRHQIPESGYSNYDQYRDSQGKPLYPQRSFMLGPMIAGGGAGSLQSGKIQGKVIVVSALLDGNLPWQADWYREQVKAYLGAEEENSFRLWYVDNAVHSDEPISEDELRIAGYLGVLHQALLDVSDWVERGVVPATSTSYRVDDGQVIIPPFAKERGGIQQVVNLTVNGGEVVQINAGDTVNLEAVIEIPPCAGSVTRIEWSLEGETDFPYKSDSVEITADGAIAKLSHEYKHRGTYFPVVKVYLNRNNDAEDKFTQVKNLCRARVIVK